jgi:hypothetical protein
MTTQNSDNLLPIQNNDMTSATTEEMTDRITDGTSEGTMAGTITETIGDLETIVARTIALTADPTAHDRHPKDLRKL